MSLGHGASIFRNGLVLYYDQGNIQKSWKGKPTTNLQLPNIIDWSNSATVLLMPSLVSPIGTPVYSVTDNNTTSYLNSTRNITVPNDSNTYTISIYIEKTFGATSARLGFNSGFTGGTTLVQLNQRFNSDTGVGNSGLSEDLGSWWRWQFQLTNNSTGNTTLYCSFFPATGLYNSGDNSVATGTAIVSAIQIEQQSFATPFVNGTRSDTQALLDLVGQNTLTATSLTYASGGTFSFNGTNSSITTASTAATLGIGTSFTISLFTRRTASPTNALQGQAGFGSGGSVSIKNSSNYFADIISANSTRYTVNITTNGNMTPYENVWVNLCVTVDGTSIRTYLNGILSASQTMDSNVKSFSAETFGIGTGYGYYALQGDVNLAQVYNRALSATEVLQNFNALRGRYGI